MRKALSLVMIICLLFISLGCQAHSKPQAEPVRINLSTQEKNLLDDYFSVFAEGALKPFAYGKVSDEKLIEFALSHLIRNKYGIKLSSNISANEVEVNEITSRYFGKVTKGEEHHKYFYDIWVFEKGVYRVLGGHSFGGEMPPFSQVDELWDNNDGTYTATVSVYGRMDGWKGDPHGTMEEWEKGDPLFWPRLKTKYRALIRPVREGDEERYILLEYVLAQ